MPEKSFEYRDKINTLGIAISMIRKMRNMTQEQLAEKAGISRTFLSSIEAPAMCCSFSLTVLYSIADALGVKAGDLLNYAEMPNSILEKK